VHDVVIRNGLLIDGTGRPGFRGDLAIDGERISAVGEVAESGCRTIDADGRIVGLAFDGNQYSIAGSFWYDIEKNRAIAVHPAIMIEALERVYKADRLLAEIELSKD